MTVFGIILIALMIAVGGIGLDYANGIRNRTHLQIAADAAAHAALVAREHRTEEQAKTIGVAIAERTLAPERFGEAIRASDIEFGTWDDVNHVFTAVPGSRDAVRVNSQRVLDRNNGVGPIFLNMAGLNNIDVKMMSVFETYYPTCLREGFVAQGRIDVQSNNTYRAGFCLHSSSHIEMNNNNTFEDGVIVAMPDKGDLIIPSDGFNSNPGLYDALRSGSYQPKLLQRIQAIIDNYDNPASDYYRPSYFTLPLQYQAFTGNGAVTAADWQPGFIHTKNCSGNQRLRIATGETLRNGVIHTNCIIVLGANTTLEDVLIISENDAVRAIDSASNVTLGRNDACAPGGGVLIVTLGGFRTTADFRAFGTQILAMKMIDFESNANGMEGVSFVSGDQIDSTSNMIMGFCNGAGLENAFEAAYFRLAT